MGKQQWGEPPIFKIYDIEAIDILTKLRYAQWLVGIVIFIVTCGAIMPINYLAYLNYVMIKSNLNVIM